MKTKGVIGKRIIRVEQHRRSDGQRGTIIDVTAIVLEDGTRLVPVTIETDTGEYGHNFGVHRPPRRPRWEHQCPGPDCGVVHPL